MVMFDQMEKEGRKELIKLYEDYIANPDDVSLEARALDCEHKYSAVQVFIGGSIKCWI